MSLLGTMKVRLTAETAEFTRGVDSARKNVQSLKKDFEKFKASTLAQVVSLGAISMALRTAFDAAKQYDSVTGSLAASARLAGQDIKTLESIASSAAQQFGLSSIRAHEFTIQISELADKAGGLQQPTKVMEAFLNVGAARGLSAADSLAAFQEAVKGSEDAVDKFFNRSPDALFAEFAASIGKTAAQLTATEKAQALVDTALREGENARGEYQAWLNSAEGLQFQLEQGMQDSATTLGKALQPALVAVIPVIKTMAEGVQMAVQGWQMLGATLSLVPALARAAKTALTDGLAAGREELRRGVEAWREIIAEIQASGTTTVPVELDLSISGRGATGAAGAGGASVGQQMARTLFDDLSSEWERLRHSTALLSIACASSKL
jgi:hypothetical protein